MSNAIMPVSSKLSLWYKSFRADILKVCVCGGFADLINHAKCYLNRIRCFGSLGIKICDFPTLSAMAYITGLGYRPTCDYIINMLYILCKKCILIQLLRISHLTASYVCCVRNALIIIFY